jgi:hypothetical protein
MVARAITDHSSILHEVGNVPQQSHIIYVAQYLFRDSQRNTTRITIAYMRVFLLVLQWTSMKNDKLHTLLKRVENWPKGAQQEAVEVLREIEEDFVVGPVTMHELDQAHQQALLGRGISMEDLKRRLNA